MKKRKWLIGVLVLLMAVMIAPAAGKTVHAATKLTLKELKWTRFYSDSNKLSLYVLPSSNVKNYTFRIYKSTNKNDPSSMQTQAVYSVITSSNIARKETFGGDFEAYIKQNPDYYYQFSVTASPANSDYLTSDETYSTAILGQWLADGYYTGCELSKLKLKVTE